jgi:hypothetical protein
MCIVILFKRLSQSLTLFNMIVCLKCLIGITAYDVRLYYEPENIPIIQCSFVKYLLTGFKSYHETA